MVCLPQSLTQVNGKISHFALKSVSDLFKDAAQSNPAFSGVTRTVHGWPCVHQILEYETKRRYFQVDDFHPQWRLMKFNPQEPSSKVFVFYFIFVFHIQIYP